MRYRFWCWCGLGLLALLLVGVAVAQNKEEQPSPTSPSAPSQGRLVLRLPYRGATQTPLGKPYETALFEAGSYSYIGRPIGTDVNGSIYVTDPTVPGHCILKRFDRQGQFAESWNTLKARHGNEVVVTQEGNIWMGVTETRIQSLGLPMVIYRSGVKEPVVDWRNKLPEHLDEKVKQAFATQGGLNRTRFWQLMSMAGGGDKVAMEFGGEVDNKDVSGNWMRKYLYLLMNDDGSRLLDIKVFADSQEVRRPSLTPNGQAYFVNSDFDLKTWKWSKSWIWMEGEEKGEPLLDMGKNPNPWPDKVLLPKDVLPPGTWLDGKGNTYMIWSRKKEGPERRFVVGGEAFIQKPDNFFGAGEYALTVLNSQRQLIAYVPWTTVYFEAIDNWIYPLPDGSGFYRVQFMETEQQVFFHPLPQ